MSRETYLNFRVTDPRRLQLSSVALRWHQLLIWALSETVENLRTVQIENDYRLHQTHQPRDYTGAEIKLLEASRDFILQPLPPRADERFLALVSGTCAIVLFARPEPFTLSDRKVVERLNLTLSLRFCIWEFTLQSDAELQMILLKEKKPLYLEITANNRFTR